MADENGNDSQERRAGQFCRMGSKLEVLEKRVGDLEKAGSSVAELQKYYHQSREDQIRRDAEIDFKMKTMDSKLDSVNSKLDGISEWKNELDNKPNKLLDNVKDKIIGAICGVIGGGIIAAIVYLIATLNQVV